MTEILRLTPCAESATYTARFPRRLSALQNPCSGTDSSPPNRELSARPVPTSRLSIDGQFLSIPDISPADRNPHTHLSTSFH